MTRHTQFRAGGAVAAVAAAFILAACGSSSSSKSVSAAGAASASAAPASPTAITLAATKGTDGTYLTGTGGRAVYLWVADTNGRSNCSGACAKVWPPVVTSGKTSAVHGADASDLGTIMRSNGSHQVTYKGHPLYYFAEDSAAGMIKGQGSDGFGAKWWLVTPSGSAITATAASSSSSSSGSGGGSSGY